MESLLFSLQSVLPLFLLILLGYFLRRKDMINDSFLGLSVIALALVIWVVALLIKDPRGVIKARLKK